MFMLKLFAYFLLLQLSTARYTAIVPKFNGQDSAIIVDADKSLPTNLNPKLQNALYYNYPVYHLIKQQQKQNKLAAESIEKTTTTTTTTTEAPLLTPINGNDDEFPSDLLYIAQHKLGLKRLDEIPSITELGELLGTANAEETIKYIRQLTDTEQGIALMKAYIESTDYTDSSSSNSDTDDDIADEVMAVAADLNDDDDDTDIEADNNEAVNDIYDAKIAEIATSTTKTPAATKQNGLLTRISNFFNSYKLWPETSATPLETTTAAAIETTTTTAVPIANRQAFTPIFLPMPAAEVQRQAMPLNFMPAQKPLLLRSPLPYHYPIPIRPILLQPATSQPMQQNVPVHLNTPKDQLTVETTSSKSITPTDAVQKATVAPHVQQLAAMANVSPKKLELFLQRKPKLAELAVRVSSLPMNQHNGAIDSQLLAAVQRAIEQSGDEDLKKLLTDTLK